MLYYFHLSIFLTLLLPTSFISFKMLNWCYYSDKNNTPFAFLFFLSIGSTMLSFTILTITNILVLMFDDFYPDTWTIAPRISMLLFLSLSAYLIKRARSANIDLGDLKTIIESNGSNGR